MIRTALQRRAGRALHRIQSHPYSLPRRRLISTSRPVSLWPWTSYRRWQSTAIVSSGEVDPSAPQLPVAAAIEACPGCGAPAQTVEPGDAGYYLNKRKAVRSFVLAKARDSSFKPGDESPRDALEGLDDRHASTAARAATGMLHVPKRKLGANRSQQHLAAMTSRHHCATAATIFCTTAVVSRSLIPRWPHYKIPSPSHPTNTTTSITS